MKKKWIYIMIVIVLIFGIYTCPRQQNLSEKNINKVVEYNMFSDINALFTTIDDLYENLVQDNNYKKLSSEEVNDIIRNDSLYLLTINVGLKTLKDLNPNYDIDINGLNHFVFSLKQELTYGYELRDSEVEKIDKIYQLRKEYSSINGFEDFDDDKSQNTLMNFPDETRKFFNELNDLTQSN